MYSSYKFIFRSYIVRVWNRNEYGAVHSLQVLHSIIFIWVSNSPTWLWKIPYTIYVVNTCICVYAGWAVCEQAVALFTASGEFCPVTAKECSEPVQITCTLHRVRFFQIEIREVFFY